MTGTAARQRQSTPFFVAKAIEDEDIFPPKVFVGITLDTVASDSPFYEFFIIFFRSFCFFPPFAGLCAILLCSLCCPDGRRRARISFYHAYERNNSIIIMAGGRYALHLSIDKLRDVHRPHAPSSKQSVGDRRLKTFIAVSILAKSWRCDQWRQWIANAHSRKHFRYKFFSQGGGTWSSLMSLGSARLDTDSVVGAYAYTET